jgi:hypothetical protein
MALSEAAFFGSTSTSASPGDHVTPAWESGIQIIVPISAKVFPNRLFQFQSPVPDPLQSPLLLAYERRSDVVLHTLPIIQIHKYQNLAGFNLELHTMT